MNLKYNIKSVSQTATMPYQPTRLELWISENKVQVPDIMPDPVEGIEQVQTFTDFIEIQSQTTQDLSNGTLVVNRQFRLPAAALQPMITGYELGGTAIINIPMLNAYLKAYHEIEIV